MADPKHIDPFSSGDDHKPSWTDGFPHSFHGWGPQTPTPDNELASDAEHINLRPDDELTWRPIRDETGDHIVWRYETTRH